MGEANRISRSRGWTPFIAVVAITTAFFCVKPDLCRAQKTPAPPVSAFNKPIASRIGPVYGPPSDNTSRSVPIDIVADFTPSSNEPMAMLSPDQIQSIRSSATLVCSDCEHPKDIAPTQIRKFSEMNQGVTLVVAVEVGQGMKGDKLASIKEGLLRIVGNKQPKDKVALVSFGNDVVVQADFSANDEDLKQAIGRLHVEPVQYPPLYRNLMKSLDLFDQVDKSFPARRLMLVVSTGRNESSGDQASSGGFRDSDVIDRANQANVVINAIGVPSLLPPRIARVVPSAQIDPNQSQTPQIIEIQSNQSVEGYLEALEKMVRRTGGLYLLQDPHGSSVADRMSEGVEWIRETPVLGFDLYNGIPSDNKSHRIVLRFSTQPGTEFASTIQMPAGPSAFGFSSGLIIFLVVLAVLAAVVLFKGRSSKQKYSQLNPPASASSVTPAAVAEETPADGAREFAPGHTSKEGAFADSGTQKKGRLVIPAGEDEPAGAKPFLPQRPLGPPPIDRGATRVISSVFQRPSPAAPCGVLRVTSGTSIGQLYPIQYDEVSLGRDEDSNMIAVPDPAVSGHHATMRWKSGLLSITDDHSRNGTRVNNLALQPAKPHVLQVGDKIQIGSTVFLLDMPSPQNFK